MSLKMEKKSNRIERDREAKEQQDGKREIKEIIAGLPTRRQGTTELFSLARA